MRHQLLAVAILWILIGITVTLPLNGKGIKEKAEGIIKSVVGESASLIFKKTEIPSPLKKKIQKQYRQRFYKNWLYTWQIQVDEQIIGHALLDNVYGKSMPITFLVLFDKDGNVTSCHIVKYREPYGDEVKNSGWLKQFTGKNHRSQFIKGKDVDGISGATISSASLIKGVGKLTQIMAYLVQIK